MPHPIRIPELLSPAGSLDAVRAAVANGADAVYLGAERFNARDEGAQLTLDEVGTACRIAHARGARIYLTLNTLVKPAELSEALLFLGEAIDRGIDAAIVQDIGIVRLIKRIYPGFEIHGSTQMTVHDVAGAEVMRRLGVERVVLARENTLEDIRAIRSAVPELGLETFIHGALCISYSGQCYMSGMISERSANRGSCAQSCRKDYVLKDADSNEILDSGYLISARDLGAYASIPEIADAGVGCLKIEGRKKKPEYVAVVTRNYRETLNKVAAGEDATLPGDAQQDLVQIFSRGFTPGMYQGRAGREYVTRSHPDNRGMVIGAVIGSERGELIVETTLSVVAGDGLAFEPPQGTNAKTLGFTVEGVRTISIGEITRLAIRTSVYVPTGWTVIRSFDMRLMAGARDSFANVLATPSEVHRALDVRVFGSPGSALKTVFSSGDDTVTARSNVALAKADKRALDAKQLREQFGRLGGTSFVLGNLDLAGLADGLFLPVSELNHVRQTAVEELEQRLQWRRDAAGDERSVHVAREVADVSPREMSPIQVARETKDFTLVAETFDFGDAIAAAAAGATEICFDPFLRHPAPPAARLRDLGTRLLADGVAVRLRLPSIVRPAERKNLAKWLALGLPMSSGHLGLVAELASQGHDVVADYAVNCFNQHAASEIFGMGASRIVLSVELTTDEMLALSKPWQGRGFDAVVYGRPEGMTIEHCVLSAAFNREPTTCRDLCVRDHTNVVLTDPAGYSFSVATDSACRNRLLHSRPLEASEFIPRLWHGGLRNYRMLFNVRGDRVAELVSGYRSLLESLRDDRGAGGVGPRQVVGGAFTRGHFARAV